MKIKSLFLYLILCISMLFMAACQAYDESFIPSSLQQGQFSVEYPKAYSISLTRGANAIKKWTKKAHDVEMEITETAWDTDSIVSTRSSNIVEDDIDWDDSPCVGLYISNKNGDMKVKNVPLNPLTHIIQNVRYDETKKTAYSDYFDVIETEEIPNASFFWDNWSQKGATPTDGANFYGIYPRPFDHFPNATWNYTRNSVISSSSVDNDDDCISYVFWEAQTDQNIKQFDLMYSQSESTTKNGVYGNQNKKNGESISMPFVHAFSLLNIQIYKGQGYTGTGTLSAISIKGTEISTTGKLNYVTGELTKGTDEGVINRVITETELSKDIPFQTEVIIPPSSENVTETEGKDKLSIICKIDGSEYKYKFPDDVKFKSGMRYNIKLTLSPSGLSYINTWYGAEVTLDSNSTPLDYGNTAILGNSRFTVKAKEGYVIEKITKNGVVLSGTTGTFDIDKNSTYNIVTHPTTNWYVTPGSMRVQFDGIQNAIYGISQNTDVFVWQDLTGNGNDGNLNSFNGTKESGWNGKNGLVFDGIDDIVIFPGNINAEEYTMEFFLSFDKQKSSNTPRLNAEGTAYPAYYLRNLRRDEALGGKWYVGLFGHNCSQYDSKVYIEEDNSLVQLDMVYQNKTIRFYKNGTLLDTYTATNIKDAVSIPAASLGNRSADNTRTTTATYYSYILYDNVLDVDEIKENYRINKARFGTSAQ